MIACIEQMGRLCVVRWTGRASSFIPKVEIHTWCNQRADPDAGVLQMPDQILSMSLNGKTSNGKTLCETCKSAVIVASAHIG
jgi:hypothetical protein